MTLPDAYPFPTDPNRDLPAGGTIPERYYKSIVRPFGDAGLEFETLVRNGWVAIDVKGEPPREPNRPVTLRLYRTPPDAPFAAEIEIQAVLLPAEITAGDWLDLYVENTGHERLRGDAPTGLPGQPADWLVRSASGAERFVFRLTAARQGPRLYLISGRVAEAGYGELAEAFAVVLFTFKPLGAPSGSFAERVRAEAFGKRLVLHPLDWTAEAPQEKLEKGMSGLALKRRQAGQVAGFIAVQAFAKVQFPRIGPLDLIALAKENLEQDAGVAFAETDEPRALGLAHFPFEGLLVNASGMRGDADAEVRIAALEDEETRYLVYVLGPSRRAAGTACALNRGAFDLLLREFRPAQGSAR